MKQEQGEKENLMSIEERYKANIAEAEERFEDFIKDYSEPKKFYTDLRQK